MGISREEQGQIISQVKDGIKRIDEFTYVVKSQSSNGLYNFHSTELGWKCDCPDHVHRGVKCKHIFAVEFSFTLREQVKKETIIQSISSVSCRYCNSDNIVKKALRRNIQTTIQRYLCKECGKCFSFNIGFERMHASPQMITSAMQLYFTGESFRNVQKFLKLQGENESRRNLQMDRKVCWINAEISSKNNSKCGRRLESRRIICQGKR